MEAASSPAFPTLTPQVESTVDVEGPGRYGGGVLLDGGYVLTSRSLVGDLAAPEVHASGGSCPSERVGDVGRPDGPGLTVLRLLRDLAGKAPVAAFAQVAPGDEVVVVTSTRQGDDGIVTAAVSETSLWGALVLDAEPGGVVLEGSPVFVDDALVAIVSSATPDGVEAVALTDVAGELAAWAPQIRDAVWPVGPALGPSLLGDPAATTPAAAALLRWFDGAYDDRAGASAALWAAFILLAEETPRQNVASLVVDDLRASVPDASGTWLLVQLGFDELPAHQSREPDPGRLDLLAPVGTAAARLRDLTEPEGPLHLRHLLAAALEVWPEPFTSIGGDVTRVRAALLATLRRDQPANTAEAWARQLSTPAQVADRPHGRRIASIDADAIGNERQLTDDLHVRNDVETLCDVLAARDAEPPVSVGLFGQWGTGKSYFMELMRQRMDELAAAAKAEVKAGRQPAYCDEIQQITFNAWHYMDANLWASLAVGLFEGMAAGGAPVPSERAAKLRVELQLREQKLSPVEVKLRTALEDPRLGEAAKELGIDATHGEVLELATEASRFGGFVRPMVRTLLAPTRWSKVRAVTAASVAAVVLGLAAAGVALARDAGGLGGAAAWIPALLTLAAALGRTAAGTRRAIKRVNDVLETFSLRNADVTRERIEADREIMRIRAELAELEKSRALYDYVLDRAGSDDYHRHFGVISVVRKDLETLVKRLAETAPSRRIVLYIDDLDRCPPARVVEVLQAVHLLLAFPLFVVVVGVDPRWLLRSLERHYRQILSTDHGRPHEERDDGLTEATPHDYLEKIFQIPFSLPPMTKDGFGRLVATLVAGRPPAAGSTGGAEKVDRVAEGAAGSAVEREPVQASGTQRRQPPAGLRSGTGAPPPEQADQAQGVAATGQDAQPRRASTPAAEPPAAAASDPIDPNPPKLNISDDEVAALSGVGPLIPTPRSAKRLVNLYRLIKAGLGPSEVDAFVHEMRYEALVVVLAALVGFPRQARPLLIALCEAGSTEPALTFETFVRGLGRRPIVEALTERSGDADDWDDLVAALGGVLDLLPHAAARPLQHYLRWVPSVQRYSFDGALDALTVSTSDDPPKTASA